MKELSFCPVGERQLAPYLEKRLRQEERANFETHLAGCATCQGEIDLWEKLSALPTAVPGPYFKQDFEAMLRRESALQKPIAKLLPFWRQPMVAWAAAAALAIGGFIAGNYSGGQKPKSEITELREEIRGMRGMVAMSLLQQQSAVERLRGVNYSVRLDNPDEDVVNALVATLRGDSSVDVRLAAAEALRRYSGRPRVRQAMADSLQSQDSPLLQLTLIDSLVEFRERRTGPALEALSRSPDLDPTVKTRVERALRELKVQ